MPNGQRRGRMSFRITAGGRAQVESWAALLGERPSVFVAVAVAERCARLAAERDGRRAA